MRSIFNNRQAKYNYIRSSRSNNPRLFYRSWKETCYWLLLKRQSSETDLKLMKTHKQINFNIKGARVFIQLIFLRESCDRKKKGTNIFTDTFFLTFSKRDRKFEEKLRRRFNMKFLMAFVDFSSKCLFVVSFY